MRRRRYSFFMPPEEHDFLRWLEDQYRGLLTPLGRAVLLACVLAPGLLVLGGLSRPLVATFAFGAAAALSAILVGAVFRPKLRLTRHLPPPVSAGDPLVYRVTVENVGR